MQGARYKPIQSIDTSIGYNDDITPLQTAYPETPKPRRKSWRIPSRYVLLIMCMLNTIISYSDRTNMAVAMLPMSEEYKWSESTRGFILSAFFYGYMIAQVLGGFLAFKYGGQLVLGVSCTVWSLLTCLTPLTAPWVTTLVLCRGVLGLAEGMAFPSIMALIAKHVPPREYARSIAFVMSGKYVGAILANCVSAMLATSSLGWPFIFYLFGSVGFVWVLPWLFCKFTPLEEALFVEAPGSIALEKLNSPDTIGSPMSDVTRVDAFVSDEDVPSIPSSKLAQQPAPFSGGIPWRDLLRRREIWAILIGYFAQSWSFGLILNWLPYYYQDKFSVDMHHMGFFTVMPYIAQGIAGNLAGILGDYLINKLKWRKTTVRKLMQCGGMFGISLFLLMAAFAESAYEGMTYVTLGMAIYNLTLAGICVNHLDVSPTYAPVIYGMGQAAGQIPGILGVWLTGWILQQTHGSWAAVFGLSAFVTSSGSIVWALWSGADILF